MFEEADAPKQMFPRSRRHGTSWSHLLMTADEPLVFDSSWRGEEMREVCVWGWVNSVLCTEKLPVCKITALNGTSKVRVVEIA